MLIFLPPPLLDSVQGLLAGILEDPLEIGDVIGGVVFDQSCRFDSRQQAGIHRIRLKGAPRDLVQFPTLAIDGLTRHGFIPQPNEGFIARLGLAPKGMAGTWRPCLELMKELRTQLSQVSNRPPTGPPVCVR